MPDTFEFECNYVGRVSPLALRFSAETEQEARELLARYLKPRVEDFEIQSIKINPLGSACRNKSHTATAWCRMCGYMSDWYRRYGF